MTRSEVSLQIDFLQSSGALTSSNSEISNLNEDAWAGASDLDFSADMAGVTSLLRFFSSQINFGSGSYFNNKFEQNIDAVFYGPNAEEAGGSWRVISEDKQKIYHAAYGVKR